MTTSRATGLDRPTRLYQRIARSIATDLATESGSTDLALSAGALAERFQVSRQTAREAMVALEVTGVVVQRARGRPEVLGQPTSTTPGLSSCRPQDLILAQAMFEGEAAALAAVMATADDLALICRLARRGAEQPASGWCSDATFHLAIARASHNAAVVQVIADGWAKLGHVSARCACTCSPPACGAGANGRTKIVVPLLARDPEAARSAMRDHFALARRRSQGVAAVSPCAEPPAGPAPACPGDGVGAGLDTDDDRMARLHGLGARSARAIPAPCDRNSAWRQQ